MKTFYTRTLSAVVFAAVMLVGMLWNVWSFCILFLIIAVLGLKEYFGMIPLFSDHQKIPFYQQLIVLLLLPAGFLIASGEHFSLLGQSALFFGLQLFAFLLMLLIMPTAMSKQPAKAFGKLRYNLLGLLYVGLPFSLMIHLRWNFSIEHLPVIPLGIIFSLWINDSLAYITGSLIGKTPFFPSISPKKTWEGTLGGILFTILAGALYGYYGSTFTMGLWIAIAGITALAGTAGDLLESKLKRRAGIKDSGNILPGHGGILDRFDSLILATPFVWMLVNLCV